MKIVPLSLALMFAAGAAAAADYGPESPYYRYPAGLSLTLLRPLAVPPDSATVRLQFGRIVARNGVQEVEPHCIFELDTVRDREQPVLPHTMQVTDVRRNVSTFSGMPAWPLFGPSFLRVGSPDDGGPSHIYYKTEFRLRSAQQPEVRALTCQSNPLPAGAAFMRHLTLPEIRAALGGYFSLNLP